MPIAIPDLKIHLLYDPASGSLTRRMTGKPIYIEATPGGPRIELLGKRPYARPVVWAWMTGVYPRKYRVIAPTGNLYDLRWENFYEIPEGFRICAVCGVEQPNEQFSNNQRGRCRGCTNQHAKKYARRTILRRYGLTPETYAEMLAAQGGVCAICREPPTTRKLAVDHCHKTGAVRRLLCGRCNVALGGFADSPVRLLRAAQYLLSKLPDLDGG